MTEILVDFYRRTIFVWVPSGCTAKHAYRLAHGLLRREFHESIDRWHAGDRRLVAPQALVYRAGASWQPVIRVTPTQCIGRGHP